jgi:membrane-associated phospholipid phosphatase
MKKLLLGTAIVLSGLTSQAQRVDTLIKKLDSLSKQTDSVGKQVNNIEKQAYNQQTKITFPNYFILMGSTLKQQFTAPFHWDGSEWKTFGLFVGATGALMLADEPLQRFALDLRNHNRGLRSIGNFVTSFGGLYETYTLATLGVYSFVFKNEKLKTTTLLATQAYIAGGAMQFAGKYLFGRLRPNYYDPNATEVEPRFTGPFGSSGYDVTGKKLNSSFPSGHTTVAFAAATVFAKEYRDIPYIPIAAYTAATLVGLSRITENKHWATDVLAGAALGYFTGKLVVNNYHRYAKLKAPGNEKTLSFFIQPVDGRFIPGLVYTF